MTSALSKDGVPRPTTPEGRVGLAALLVMLGLEGIAFASSISWVRLFIVVIGFGGGILNGGTNALVADISAGKRGANLSLLGVFRYNQKYPNGTPTASGTGGLFFPETGKHVAEPFLTYWKTHGGLAQQPYTLATIPAPPNRPPLFTSTPVVGGDVNTPYSYRATAIDKDGDLLTFSLTSGPAGMVVNASTGQLSWTPAPER